MKPELFIGSSVEGLSVVNALTEKLHHRFNITSWDSGVFNISGNTLDDLLIQLKKSDFAIFVFTPDDKSIIRETEHSTVRDNVLYELGLYTGKLGRKNTFYLKPDKMPSDFHLPTDLIGVTAGSYDSTRTDNLVAALSPFCSQLQRQIFDPENYFLSGKWNFNWSVESETYPKENKENAFIFHYSNTIKGQYTGTDDLTYIFKGEIKGQYIEGFWSNKLGGATYHGTFHIKIEPSTKILKGVWTGWSNQGIVKAGECVWTKLP
ncbi:nucleotide-binding protein [Mucilaginibacter sp. HMF5004]|uniref:TIR domain-containing protein n=1 Tax=Mucilaginibacter rivuli TaxID=2857527 RepID=UPI001C5D3194|nr:nucleotide-binding protein [Mucilaginibacter rivuli]MBW4889117.1 nucleotide-binding protein [Mucilaginibacter rivuli]